LLLIKREQCIRTGTVVRTCSREFQFWGRKHSYPARQGFKRWSNYNNCVRLWK